MPEQNLPEHRRIEIPDRVGIPLPSRFAPLGPDIKWPIALNASASFHAAFIHEGMQDAPKDREFLARAAGSWVVLRWYDQCASSYHVAGFFSDWDMDLINDRSWTGRMCDGKTFEYWCELPGDPTKVTA